MELKAIDIDGNIVLLEKVMSISVLKKWNEKDPSHFQIDFKDGKKTIVFYEATNSKVVYYSDENRVHVWVDEYLTDFRDKIIKIVTNE